MLSVIPQKLRARDLATSNCSKHSVQLMVMSLQLMIPMHFNYHQCLACIIIILWSVWFAFQSVWSAFETLPVCTSPHLSPCPCGQQTRLYPRPAGPSGQLLRPYHFFCLLQLVALRYNLP